MNKFTSVEFGLALSIDNKEQFVRIPIDLTVKDSLIGMRKEFYSHFREQNTNKLQNFSPSEKYASTEILKTKLNQKYLSSIKKLYEGTNLPVSNVELTSESENIGYYFAIFHYEDGNHELAVKRPSYFKGLLKKKNKLVRLVDDTLKVISDDVFKLDNDFDFIVESNDIIKILHPAGFIFISDMEEQILKSAVESAAQLTERIPCVNFTSFTDYISKSKRAAKLIASIKSREDLEKVSKNKLQKLCGILKIDISEVDGQIQPNESNILDFLYVLDRRQYDIDITDLDPEIYIAASRKQIR